MKEDKNIDIDIKKFLEENENIEVPKGISEGINNTLEYINKNNSKKYNYKRKLVVASIIGTLIITAPFVTKAAIEKLYKYIPGEGNVMKVEGKLYILEDSITKQKGNSDITLSGVVFNEEVGEIEVKVEGEFAEPSKHAKLTINGKSKRGEGYITSGSSDGRTPDKWIYKYTFKHKEKYNNDKMNIKISWDDGRSVDYELKLKEANSSSNYKRLGVTDTKLNVGITGFVKERKNTLDINLTNDIRSNNEGIYYGMFGYPTDDWSLNLAQDDIITLTDARGSVVKGILIEHEDRNNHFRFDIEDLIKPYTINVPSISILTRGEVSISDEIELNVEGDLIETNINKTIEMNVIDELYKSGNTKVRLIKGMKDGNRYNIDLEYINDESNPINMEWISIIPSGNSIKNEEWFETGTSGSILEENRWEISFDLPYPNENKLYIKLKDNSYKIEGNWNLVIE